MCGVLFNVSFQSLHGSIRKGFCMSFDFTSYPGGSLVHYTMSFRRFSFRHLLPCTDWAAGSIYLYKASSVHGSLRINCAVVISLVY